MIKLADARKSDAITGAAFRQSTPLTVAILPFAVRMEGVSKILAMCFG